MEMVLCDGGKPITFKHKCPPDREGQIMTQEELQAFAVEVLYEEYKMSGENIKLLSSDIDMSLIRDWLTINIKVLYQPKFDLRSCVFDSFELLKRYYEEGEIPRLILASAFCEDTPTGMQAICGAEYFFKFYPINLIPDEKKFMLPVELNRNQLLQLYVDAWNNFDASIIEPYLDKDFHYSSDAVFDVMPSRFEYIDYFKIKLETLRILKKRFKAKPGRLIDCDDLFVFIEDYDSPDEDYGLFIETFAGRITSARMLAFDKDNK